MKFKLWLEQESELYQQLMALRPQLAAAAQEEYNGWEQDEEGLDDIHGGGGICDDIERAIVNVVGSSISDADITLGGQPGDDHAWTVVYNNTEAYGVDIPPHIYEQGGGMSWQKIPGVVFKPDDVEIWDMGVDPANFADDGW